MQKIIEQIKTLRATELACQKERHKLEADLAQEIAPPLDGSASASYGSHRVTATAKLKRAVDWDLLDAADISDIHREAVTRLTRALDLKNLKLLQAANPAVYKRIASCITATPSKVAITIKTTESE